MRYVTLKTEEIKALEVLYKSALDNSTRKRSHCLLLSHQRRTITDLSKVFELNRRTIERWLNDWAVGGVDSLPILKGHDEEIAKLLEVHSRNLKNVLLHFEKEHNIKICKKTLQNFLKDTGL